MGQTAALEVLYRQVVRQAMMLAFNDAFFVMFLFTLAVAPLVLLFRSAQTKNGPIAAH